VGCICGLVIGVGYLRL